MSNNTRLSFLKSFIGFSVSSWVGAGLSIISTPIVTRVFSTTEIGKINLFITIVNLFLNFTYLGIDQAYTRFYHEPPGKNDKNSFLSVCLMLTGLVVFIVAMGIFVSTKALSNTVLGYVTFIIPVSMIVSLFSNVILRFFNLSARMEKNALLFNIQAIAITLVSNVSYVAVALYKPTAENAIIFRSVLTLFIAGVFFAYSRKKVSLKNIDTSKEVIKTILFYALPICPATILSVMNNSIGQILMKTFVSYEAIGIYSNAVTIASIITIIQHGFSHFWSPFVYENYKTNQKQIIKVHHVSSFVMILFALCIIFCQDLIYTLLVGKAFWASKQIFPLLIISPVCYTISETLGIGVRISKKTFLNIPVYAINLVVNIGICLLLLPKIGVVGAALASAISSIAMLTVKSILGERTYRCSDNYFKVIVALLSLFITAMIHTFVYESMIRYIVYLVAFVVVVCCYTAELKTILLLCMDLKNKLLRK